MRQQRRINQSMTDESLWGMKLEHRRTKMRIPSASAFQFSVIFLSSSSAISKYIEKIGPDPSMK